MCRGGTNKAFLDLGYVELAERRGRPLVDLNEDDYELMKDPEALRLKDANILGLNPLSAPHIKLAQDKGQGAGNSKNRRDGNRGDE